MGDLAIMHKTRTTFVTEGVSRICPGLSYSTTAAATEWWLAMPHSTSLHCNSVDNTNTCK